MSEILGKAVNMTGTMYLTVTRTGLESHYQKIPFILALLGELIIVFQVNYEIDIKVLTLVQISSPVVPLGLEKLFLINYVLTASTN